MKITKFCSSIGIVLLLIAPLAFGDVEITFQNNEPQDLGTSISISPCVIGYASGCIGDTNVNISGGSSYTYTFAVDKDVVGVQATADKTIWIPFPINVGTVANCSADFDPLSGGNYTVDLKYDDTTKRFVCEMTGIVYGKTQTYTCTCSQP